jgi:hypothetical protein
LNALFAVASGIALGDSLGKLCGNTTGMPDFSETKPVKLRQYIR